MNVTLSNLRSSAGDEVYDSADIVVSYGTTVETYRQVQIASLTSASSPLKNSGLVTVTRATPTAFPAAASGSYPLGYTSLQEGRRAGARLQRHKID